MPVYSLHRKQFLSTSLSQAWEFFSNPHNLKLITPSYLEFKIETELIANQPIYPGMIIIYSIRPFWRISWNWVTEITHVKHENYFVDEQRIGPYAFWHHEHFFREAPGGVEMEDLVHYQLPFGFLGRLVHAGAVQQKLTHIFDFRFAELERRFNHRLKI